MPVKKEQSDILYVPKDVSAYTPHPILLGCGDVSLILNVKKKENDLSTSCDVNLQVNLNKNTANSGISKLVDAILAKNSQDLNSFLNYCVNDLYDLFELQVMNLKISFPYYISRKTPVSNKDVWYKYDTSVVLEKNNTELRSFLKISVPYSSSCPISKEISDYGSHNQRGIAIVTVELNNFNDKGTLWFEDIVSIVDKSCSSPVYNNTNLQDEAYQTEMLYENSLHIEEIIKNISEKLKKQKNKGLKGFVLNLEQHESINTYKVSATLSSKGENNDN
jgi:GTP cyclohydrolase I